MKTKLRPGKVIAEGISPIEQKLGEDVQYSELCDLLPDNLSIPRNQDSDVVNWIEQEYRRTRGCGLVSLGPDVLPTLWQQQSKNWEVITNLYIKDILFFVHDFIVRLLRHVCPDERTRNGLFSTLLDPILERYRRAIKHVHFIVKVERFGTPLTLNH